MVALPTGSVTLLFSDIEGSTLLVRRLGSDWTDALDSQRRLLREAWTCHDGVELGTEGDSFFVAFDAAAAGVQAAVAAQRAMAHHAWPQGEHVVVRMGLHTGTPLVHDGGYVGLDVHRAARIAAAAHGGQVLVSEATKSLASRGVAEELRFTDLGRHRLKDLLEPERLFQVQGDDLRATFPPVRSLGAPSRLPTTADRLVGRDAELVELTRLLSGAEARLVTLTGPGGSGKTSLGVALARALAVAPQEAGQVPVFPDGVFFVPLAEVTGVAEMWRMIGEALAVPNVRRNPSGVVAEVEQWRALLVLDNLEQLVGADEVVDVLLRETTSLALLTTSRQPLHVAGEYDHPVPALDVPADDSRAAVNASAAAQMFTDCVRRVQPAFELTDLNAGPIAQICRRLDGLPLALQLVAARSKVLGPKAIAARLDQALDVVSNQRSASPRQHTLRETIAWSYRLLDEEQRRILRGLGVFAGGGDLDAVAAVCGEPTTTRSSDGLLEALSSLVDASLVNVVEAADGEPRFTLLETIRAFARDEMRGAGELQAIQERHASHFVDEAEALAATINGPSFVSVVGQFAVDYDNFREALAWATTPGSSTSPGHDANALGLRLIAALMRYWRLAGLNAEDKWWTERILEVAAAVDSAAYGRVLERLAVHRMSTNPAEAKELARKVVEIGRRVNDERLVANSLVTLGDIHIQVEGDREGGIALYKEAWPHAQRSEDADAQANVLEGLCEVSTLSGDFEGALTQVAREEELIRARDNPLDRLRHEHGVAWVQRRAGRPEQALDWIQRAVRSALAIGFAYANGMTYVAEDYACILADLGQAADAARLLGAADARRERIDAPRAPYVEADIEPSISKARAVLTAREWEDAYGEGRQQQLEDALTVAHRRTEAM